MYHPGCPDSNGLTCVQRTAYRCCLGIFILTTIVVILQVMTQ